MIYLPGSGIMASYTDSETGVVEAQFYQALAIYIWAWFILTVLFSIAAIRSSWILFLDLVILSVCLLLLACGNMVGKDELLTAGYSFGLVVAFLSCESALSLLFCSYCWLRANNLLRLGRMRWIVGRRHHPYQTSDFPHARKRLMGTLLDKVNLLRRRGVVGMDE